MKRKSSLLLAFIMVFSVILSSGINIRVFAADEFSWAFKPTQPAPVIENIAAETQNVTGTGIQSVTLNGYFTGSTATTNCAAADAVTNVTNQNTGSKFCTATSGRTWPVNVMLTYSAPITPQAYILYGANDDGSYARAPSQWTIYATNNASETATNFNAANWTQLDYQNQQYATSNYQQRYYTFTNTTAYTKFLIRVTGRQSATNFGQSQTTSDGQIQFSCFGFAESVTVSGFSGTTNYLYPNIAASPGAMVDGSASPWNGENVLSVSGTTGGSGSGTISAKSYTTIRKNLDVQVYPDTKLSYLINPNVGSSYSYALPAAFFAIDLEFTDGTRLSKDYDAKDYLGYPMTPVGQGQAKVSVMSSWNYVECNVGQFVPAGKVIDKIIVGYEDPTAPRARAIRADFDDLRIFRRDDAAIINATELADYTDVRFGTRVGSYGMGACSPLVGTPNPFNYWVPCTATSTSSPYNSQDRTFNYIRLSHQASRWFTETATATFTANTTGSTTAGSYAFTKDNEFAAHSYYYGIKLDNGVSIEVTPTEHGAVLRYTWPSTASQRSVVVTGLNGTPTRSGVNLTATANGTSYSMPTMYIRAIFNATPSGGSTASGNAVVNFAANPTGPNNETVVEMKIATSCISSAQALQNMDLEIDSTDNFDSVKAKSKAIWNKVLAAAAIEDNTASYWDLVDFYSKFARSTMYPTILHENTQTGTIANARANPKWQYRSPYKTSYTTPIDGPLSYNEGFWDTFRTKWTMLAFFRPNDAGMLFDGIVDIFKDNNSRGSFGVPRWIKPGGSNLMVMTSSDVIATEMYARNVPYDYENGYAASLKSSTVYTAVDNANGGRNGIHTSIFDGYSAYGQSGGTGGGSDLSLSWSLEGYVNDAGTAKMAKGLRDEALAAGDAEAAKSYDDEYKYFENRAKYYTLLFNPTNTGSVGSAGWFMNKNRAGQWLGGAGSTSTTFNALDWGWGFCEDNAFNYVVTVPHDGRGLANLFGGKKAFGDKMRFIFSDAAWQLYGNGGGYGGMIHEAQEKREIKIGQWGLSNEPAEHMQSMWLFTDTPEMAAYYTRLGLQRAGGSIQIGRGMIGEEDNGAMASWWTWAYMGIFPLDNGSGNVVLGSPRFKKVTFTLDDGRSFVFEAPNAGPQNCYVNGVKINGVPYDKLYFTQDLFQDGNVFEFDMSDTPDTSANSYIRTAQQPPSLTETGDGAAFGPDILMDIVPTGVTRGTTLPSATSTTKTVTVATSSMTTANAQYLFDNSSATSTAPFASNPTTGSPREITYYSPTPVKVEIYTLTSSRTTQGADPKTWDLLASNDGSTWVTLDSRSLPNITTVTNTAVTNGYQATRTDETFRWRGQTKPFAIDPAKQGKYKYYRLSITAASSSTVMQLSQIELLADQYYEVNKDALLTAIDQAKEIITAQQAGPLYGQDEYNDMLAVLADAQAVYDDPDAIGRVINNAVSTLNAAKSIPPLVLIRKAEDLFLAAQPAAATTVANNQGYQSTYNLPDAVDNLKSETTNNCTGAVTGNLRNIGGSTPGSILGYKYIDFGSGDRLYTRARAVYAGVTGASGCDGAYMLVRLDAPDGPVIANISTPPSGSAWTLYQNGYGNITKPGISGLHNVYFELQSEARHVANIYAFQFEYVTPAPWNLSQTNALVGNDLTINPVVLYSGEENAKINVYAAVYDPDGKLLIAKKVPVDMIANSRLALAPIVIDVAGYPAGYGVKLFLWDDDYIPVHPVVIAR